MANLLEILVTSDSNNSLATCNIWDPNTGTNLMTYKGGGTSESRTLSFIGNDYLAAVEKTKPVLHVWALNSHQTVQGIRFILPGKASAFAVSKDGAYCIAGIDEKIYLWQIASGNLLTIITRHYQQVKLIKFTPDGRFFVSAGEDGMVMVWSLATVAAHPEVELVTQTTAGQHDPVYIFGDHTLPVTDMCISKTGMHGRLCTVSSDRTCKIYDLTSGEMLLNLVFDEPLSAVTMDVLELNIYVGTTEGKIYEFSLINPPRNRYVLVNSTDNKKPDFLSHTKAVTCLSASMNGDILMSGGNDERVILWHIKSRQPVRTIMHKGSITNAFFTLNFDAIYKQDFTPNIILHSLERTLEKDNDDITEIEILINKKINFWPEDIKSDFDSTSSKYLEVEFKQREETLKEEIDKLKKVNANMYEYSMKNIFNCMPVAANVDSSTKKKKKKKKN